MVDNKRLGSNRVSFCGSRLDLIIDIRPRYFRATDRQLN